MINLKASSQEIFDPSTAHRLHHLPLGLFSTHIIYNICIYIKYIVYVIYMYIYARVCIYILNIYKIYTCVCVCIYIYIYIYITSGHGVAQLVEALRYNPGRSRVRFPMVSLEFFH